MAFLELPGILNLKNLSEFVLYYHFKMDAIETA